MFICVKKVVNIFYQFSSKEKNVENIYAFLRYES